jgi:nicotinamidase-related amidase
MQPYGSGIASSGPAQDDQTACPQANRLMAMGNRCLRLTSRSVHLCVDMQRLFSAGGPWETPWMTRVLPQCVALAAHCPNRTLFTRFITPENPQAADGAWRDFYDEWPETTRSRIDPELFELVPELDQFVPPALVFDKPVYSAFAGRNLPSHLKEHLVDTVILSGAETDICVLATALGAIDHGFHVIVAVDAVCSFSDTGHDALIRLFHERFSRQVATADTAEILELWPRA